MNFPYCNSEYDPTDRDESLVQAFKRALGCEEAIIDWSRYIGKDQNAPLGSGGFGQVYGAKWVDMPSTIGALSNIPIAIKFFKRLSPGGLSKDKQDKVSERHFLQQLVHCKYEIEIIMMYFYLFSTS